MQRIQIRVVDGNLLNLVPCERLALLEHLMRIADEDKTAWTCEWHVRVVVLATDVAGGLRVRTVCPCLSGV
jgi:hypothetical protein